MIKGIKYFKLPKLINKKHNRRISLEIEFLPAQTTIALPKRMDVASGEMTRIVFFLDWERNESIWFRGPESEAILQNAYQ